MPAPKKYHSAEERLIARRAASRKHAAKKRANDPDGCRAYKRKYRSENADRICAVEKERQARLRANESDEDREARRLKKRASDKRYRENSTDYQARKKKYQKRYATRNPDKIREARKRQARRARAALSDYYVCLTLGIPASVAQMAPGLIEVKRLNLKAKRKLNELSQ